MGDARPPMKKRAPPAIEWVRPPVQDRSQKTLLRVLEATADLLEDRPFEAISVSDIVKRARSSVGAFYARFQNKDAVLHSLHERYAEESRATAERGLDPETWEGVPLADVIERFCEFIVAASQEKAGVRRALLIAAAHDEVHADRSRELSRFIIGRMRALLERRHDEVRHPSLPMAADFVHRFVFAVLDQELIFGGNPTGEPVTPEELTRELNQGVRGYLQLR